MFLGLRSALGALIALILVFIVTLSPRAMATNYWWDGNSTTTGAGATPTGTWGTSAFWGTNAAGTTATTNPLFGPLDSLTFAAGTDAVNAYTVTVNGTQTVQQLYIEEGAPTFSGGTIGLSSGGGIDLAAGASNVTVGSNLTLAGSETFSVGTGRTLAMTGTISGAGSLVVSGSGVVTLSNAGANTYAGGTVVNGGTLAIVSNGAVLPAGKTVTVNTGGMLSFGNGTTISNSAGAVSTLALNGGTFRVSGGSGDFYLNQMTIGTSGGTIDFTGTTNFWTRFTGASPGITVSATSTWTGSSSSRILNESLTPLNLNLGGNTVYTSVMFAGLGSNGFRLTGSNGTLVLNNPTNENAADFRVENAYLQVSDMSYLGSGAITLAGTALGGSTVDTTARLQYTGATATSTKPLVLDAAGGDIYHWSYNSTLTLSGVISETGGTGRALTIYGDNFSDTSVTELTAANSYTGPTAVNYRGVLSIPTIANGGVASPLGASSNASANLQLGNGFYGGAGTLRYTGTTASSNRGMTLGSFGGKVDVTDVATNLTLSGAVVGAGNLTKIGGGTLTLSGASTYTGGTTITQGTLALGSAGAIGSSGPILMNGGTLQFSASNTTDYSARFSSSSTDYRIDTNGQSEYFSSPLTGAGSLTKLGSGFMYLKGANTYSGGTTISAGAIDIGAGGTTGSISGNIVNNSQLNFSRSNNITFSGNISGTGSVGQFGTGTLTLAGNNTYTSVTQISAGVLNLGSANAIGPSGYIFMVGGTLQYSASNTADYSSRFYAPLCTDYRIDTNGQWVTFNSALTGTASLTKLGTNILTLNAANTYSGGTTIAAGLLAIGNGNTTGSIVGNVVNNGEIAFLRSDAITFSGNISGAGIVSQQGSGVLTLTGNNTYTDNTYVDSGILNLGSAGAIGSTNAIILDGGTLQYSASNTIDYSSKLSAALSNNYRIDTNGQSVTFASAISGASPLTKLGAGTLTLTNSANVYSGGTVVSGGTLAVAVSGAGLPAGKDVAVNSGATFNYGNGAAFSNTSFAIGKLTLNQGTYRVSGGNGDFYLNQLVIGASGGTVNFSGTTNFWTHLTGAGAAITAQADTTWTGAGTSRILNQSGALADFTISPGRIVTSSIKFDGTGSNGFRLIGSGALYLSNPTSTNTADFRVEDGYVRVADMNHLGSGVITLAGSQLDIISTDTTARLWFEGATASSSKTLVLDASGGNIWQNGNGTTLTLTGVISEAGGTGRALSILGVNSGAASVVELTGANSYTGATSISQNGVLSIPTIANGGVASTLGASGNASANLKLGSGANGGTGTLRYTGTTASSDRGMLIGIDGGTVEVTNAATNLSFSGPVNGSGSLTKAGPGTLTFTSLVQYQKATSVTGGSLVMAGIFNPSVSSGTTLTVSSGANFSVPGSAKFFTVSSPSSDVTVDGSLDIKSNTTSNISNVKKLTGTGTVNVDKGKLNNTAGPRITTLNITGGGVVAILPTLANPPLANSAITNGVVTGTQGSPEGVTKVTNLSISVTSKLDLTNNALVIPSTGTIGGDPITVARLRASIIAGRGGVGTGFATWSGTGGIGTSSFNFDETAASLGYIWNADPNLLPGAIDSVNGFTVSGSDYIVKFTSGADSNLDGVVDDIDVAVIGLTYDNGASTGHHWYESDYNYDGKVDDDDVAILGLSYAPGASPLSPTYHAPLSTSYNDSSASGFASGGIIVPEPQLLGALGLISGFFLKRKRGQS